MPKHKLLPVLLWLAACDPESLHDPELPAAASEPDAPPDLPSDVPPDAQPEPSLALDELHADLESAYDGNLWLDACQAQDPELKRLLAAEAMLVPVPYLHDNGDDTFAISTILFNELSGKPLDPTSLFHGQRRTGFGRSGVLVGPDIVVTAPHTSQFDFAGFRVVFGLSSRMVNGVCVQPDWDHVPAENIYEPVEVIANTYTDGIDPHDFAFLRLDRLTDREPLRIRRSGKARDGDRMAGVGHPMRLSTKISPEGEALGWDVARGLLLNGLHFLDGSSGSMVYNQDADYLETVVRSGLCGSFQLLPGNIYKLAPLCPAAPQAVNRPIADVAELVPATSLVVGPLDVVKHRANLNANPSPAAKLYTLRNPQGLAQPIQWQIVMPPAPNGQPKLTLSPSKTSGVLAPGGSFAFTATASAASQCGNYTRTIQVNDLTHGYTDYIRHEFEVGMRQFQVTPAEGFEVERMTGPYSKPGRSYTVTNTGPTPVKLRVQGPAWVDLAVQQGPYSGKYDNVATIDLAGHNSKTGTATVSVRMDEAKAAVMHPHQTHAGQLAFTMDFGQASPNCYIPSNTTRPIRFVRGKQSYVEHDPDNYIPGHANPLVNAMQVDTPFVIDHVSLDVGIWGLDSNNSPEQFSELRITLVTPGGAELPIWDLNDVPSPDYYSNEVTHHWGYELPIGVLHIDDVFSPSPLGTELGSLVGQPGEGTWKLKVSSPGTGAAFFINWGLNFFGSPPP